MADTDRTHATHQDLPVEGDGINYRGIVWFIVVLTVTVVISQVLMWGMFRVMASRVASADPPRAPLARPFDAVLPEPTLLLDEPANLRDFRVDEDVRLTTYGWIDRNAGTVRLPIDRAKELLLERGLPSRGAQ